MNRADAEVENSICPVSASAELRTQVLSGRKSFVGEGTHRTDAELE